ncbi:anthranilate phosphoribosyltransferase [Streptomyces sp. NPDC000594]|uniref:anthranilate phosphoribosyltransferase n=1 Tax=Streptomyces sp. NPDC000594 TaxID=3154261 RepID=UPI00332EF99B
MHDVTRALLTRNRPVDRRMWRSFWDELHSGGLQPGETVALLASLATRGPDPDTLGGLLRSLDERRPATVAQPAGTVNIVGTGGGPRTFNISTASAFVAAAMGVRVVKTGSRAHTGTCGSFDLLEHLGIGLTTSYGQTEAVLERFGIAFPGHFVYPRELTSLARSILPMELRTLGGFLNGIGPFLAAMPVSCQLVGVSDPSLLRSLRGLAAQVTDRRIWLCANELGVDELVGSVDNVIHTYDHTYDPAGTGGGGTGEIRLRAGALVPASGAITELRPADAKAEVVEHFLGVLSGRGTGLATGTVCLNAAALAVASGHGGQWTWTGAVAAAGEALRGGAALDLVHRLRAQPAHRPIDTVSPR